MIKVFFLFIMTMSVLIAHGHVYERINSVNQKIKQDSSNVSLYLKRGKLYLEEYHFKEAMDDFKRVKQKQATHSMIDYYIAKIYLKSKEYVLARKHTNISVTRVKEDKDLALVYEQLAEIERITNHFDIAIELYKKVLLLDIEFKPKHYNQLIKVYKLKGKKENENILKLINRSKKDLGCMAIFEDEALAIELEEKIMKKL